MARTFVGWGCMLRGRLDRFWREPELVLALRLSAGVAFLLAGLVHVFVMDATGTDYFVQVRYTRTFHRFILTAEVLGGAALLLPWPWLTLVALTARLRWLAITVGAIACAAVAVEGSVILHHPVAH